MRKTIVHILKEEPKGHELTVKGWVRSFRANRFIALNDGSTLNNLQCVVDFENTDPELLKRITVGAAIAVTGNLIESQGVVKLLKLKLRKLKFLGMQILKR